MSAVVSLSLAAAAGIHIAVMPEHLRASTVFGAFFAVVGAVQLAQAALILLRPTPLTSLITAAFNT
ncbi:MAG TPA: hypothetical protein VM600_01425, partial [Actinomycetota bacterium]|nr:hypothetical protein [Actinomycetota bacterium]